MTNEIRVLTELPASGVFLLRRAEKYKFEMRFFVENLVVKFNNSRLPIITNMDFGHTDPQWIMPLGIGIKAEFDCHKKEFKLIEKIFED